MALLLPYADLDQAVEGAKTALPIAVGGVDRIIEEQRLFGQALLNVASYGASVGMRSDPQTPIATAPKEFAELEGALADRWLTHDSNKPALPNWLVDLIKLVLELLVDLL